MSARNDYAAALKALEKLAVVALQDWWEAGDRFGRSADDLLDILSDPFPAITEVYGEQAALAAADYLILERSLDDEMRWLPAPTMAEVASYEQAKSSLEWAINTSRSKDGFDSKQAQKKLRGALNRLVLMPARDTVWTATVDAGTWYARVPSPGSCPFCLMLASRGAVYTRDTVLSTREMSTYHDHCRCVAVESRGRTLEDRWASLPPVNRELHDLWQNNVGAALKHDWSSSVRRSEWRNLIVHMRREKTGSDAPVRFPPIPGLQLPKYTLGAKYSTFGKVEPLPELDVKAAGHVLFGWMGDGGELPPLDESPEDHGRRAHTRADQQGHRYGTIRPGATVFPQSWSDQKIMDAVRDTIENPDEYSPVQPRAVQRTVRKTIDDVVIHAEWVNVPGKPPRFITAYPQRGKGVQQVSADGKMGAVNSPNKSDKKFKTVEPAFWRQS